MINIFLDDVRKTPNNYTRVYTAWECIDVLKNNKCNILSLDHDLGDDDVLGTGYSVLLWIEEEVALNNFIPPNSITVHSDNAGAKPKMLKAIQSIYRIYNNK